MTTQIPETLPAAAMASWCDEVDVLVIGFGIAAPPTTVTGSVRHARASSSGAA